MTPFPYKSYKKTSFVSGLYALVEAYFPGTTRLIICSVQQREINVFSGCGTQKYRVTKELQRRNFVQFVHLLDLSSKLYLFLKM